MAYGTDRLAIDSVRSIDANGYLHVDESPLTKEQVVEYLGREIPGYEVLGLDAGRVYRVYRPAEELKKAVSSFNGLPVLINHREDSADNPLKELRVGSTGTNAVFDGVYITNALSIHDSAAIELIESGRKREISAGYYYTPVLEKGSFRGESYEIRMTGIKGNHIALVSCGRAGSDVLVRDELITGVKMSLKQRILEAMRLLKGSLAMDDDVLKAGLLELVPEESRQKAAEMLEALLAAKERPSSDEEMGENELLKEMEEHFKEKEGAAAEVRPLVGTVNSSAFDSAEEIYRYAMLKAGIRPDNIPVSAYKHVLGAYIRAKTPSFSLAVDSVGTDKLKQAGIDISRFKRG